MGIPNFGRRWTSRLGLLALLIQLVAATAPMPSFAGTDGLPVWLTSSMCRSAPVDTPDDRPSTPGHSICPVCFVLSAAAAAIPPQPSDIVTPPARSLAASPIPQAAAPTRQYPGSLTLSRAPPSV
jgi:hypothetical protein